MDATANNPVESAKVQQFGLEYYGRYYGIYPGVVTANADPQSQGRVQVSVPMLGRDTPLNLYAYPVSPYAGDLKGFFFPPDVGDHVWIMFQDGHPSFPICIGGWWTNPSKTATGSRVPSAMRPDGLEPEVRGLWTKGGHRLLFDDGENGGITIQTPAGVFIKLRDTEEKIEIIASKQVVIQTTDAKVQASTVDVQASSVQISGSVVRINNGSKFAAAIGDGVVAGPHTGTVIGPPVSGRPLIP